jgi:hypothetical protein
LDRGNLVRADFEYGFKHLSKKIIHGIFNSPFFQYCGEGNIKGGAGAIYESAIWNFNSNWSENIRRKKMKRAKYLLVPAFMLRILHCPAISARFVSPLIKKLGFLIN